MRDSQVLHVKDYRAWKWKLIIGVLKVRIYIGCVNTYLSISEVIITQGEKVDCNSHML